MKNEYKKIVGLVSMIVLFVPMTFLGWLVFGGRTRGPGIQELEIKEPWSYLAFPGFVLLFIGFYYAMKAYKGNDSNSSN